MQAALEKLQSYETVTLWVLEGMRAITFMKKLVSDLMVLKTVNLGAERTEYRMIFKQKERKMARKEMVTLTNMCLIEDKEGKVVVQIRDPKRYRWLVSFPGGHIEEGENFHDSVVREVFEETGLTIGNARLVGIKHWPDKEGHRYIVFL